MFPHEDTALIFLLQITPGSLSPQWKFRKKKCQGGTTTRLRAGKEAEEAAAALPGPGRSSPAESWGPY